METARRPQPLTLTELSVRAAALTGRRVGEVAGALSIPIPEDPRRAKGLVGQIVERALGADPCAQDGPDFPLLRVELKTVPLGTSGRPLESTFCCAIAMARADQERWESSRLRRRLGHVLWIPVHSNPSIPWAKRHFGQPRLWRPTVEQERVLRADWEDLIGRIGAGAVPSAREGQWLQVRPKAANGRVRTLAPGADGPHLALPLGFYLRPSFTAQILVGASNAPSRPTAQPKPREET